MPLMSGSNFPAVAARPADGRRRPGGGRRSWCFSVRRRAGAGGNDLQIAHTGVYDTARYGSPLPARRAVITACGAGSG